MCSHLAKLERKRPWRPILEKDIHPRYLGIGGRGKFGSGRIEINQIPSYGELLGATYQMHHANLVTTPAQLPDPAACSALSKKVLSRNAVNGNLSVRLPEKPGDS